MLIVEDWFHSTQANLKWNSEYVQCWAYSHYHPFECLHQFHQKTHKTQKPYGAG